MEFQKKLQELRKQKGLTQEELAASLFVSRAAVSKWESGRGYPNIDSLKSIAVFFGITVDELLSGDELLHVAKEESQQTEKRFCDLLFGLLDCSAVIFFFLPLFGQKMESGAVAVSLLSLSGAAFYLKAVYFAVTLGMIAAGITALLLQHFRCHTSLANKISLALNALGVFLLTLTQQPYASVLLFTFLMIKVSVLLKKR